MSPHSHSSTCGSHCDPNEHQQIEGIQDSLYSKIDLNNIIALNVVVPSISNTNIGSKIFLPWNERNQESIWIESDSDDQIILQIPFTGSIKLRSITIKAGPGSYTPDKVKIFANQTLDFDEASSVEPTQSIDIAITREAIEYPLRPSKFPAVQCLTLFFPASHGEDTTRIFYIGFKGEFSEIPSRAVVTVYELQANPADHNKIQGMDSVHSQIG